MGERAKRALALAAALLGGFATFWLPDLLRPGGRLRLLLVGLDGADWRILDPLLARGDMPHLRSLVERGVRAPLSSLEPLISPPIWTSIATGVKPDRHGITWFLCDTDRPGRRIPVTSTLRQAKAFWNVLSEHGLRVGVVGWWATYPAERVRGFVVSDFVGYHGFGNTGRGIEADLGKCYPPEALERIRDLLPEPGVLAYEELRRFLALDREEHGAALRGEGRFASSIDLFASYLATARSYEAIARRLGSRQPPDVLAVYFEMPDAASHLFARFAPPRRPGIGEEGWSRFSGTVEEVYRYQDELLGRLLALGDDRTAVLVVSDHGFQWGERRTSTEGEDVEIGKAHLWHEPEGIFVAAGPGIRKGARLARASVLDVAPTVLRYLDVPLARDLDGAVLADLFEPEWLEAHPPRAVDSWGAPRKATSGEGESWEESARAFGEEQVRRLAGLGYLSRSGASTEMRAGRVALLLAEKRYAEAEEELRVLVQRSPADPSIRSALAEVFRVMGRLDQARGEVEVALTLAPGDPGLLCALAEVLAEQGDLQGAEAWVRVAVDEAGESVRAHLLLGHVLNLQHRAAEAREEFERALLLRRDCPPALYNLAVLAERAGRKLEAEYLYREAARLAPEDPRARINLGVLFADRGERREALQALSEAARLAPENAEARYNLGVSFLEEAMFGRAIEEFEAAARANPDFLPAHFGLGRAHLAAGRREEALRSFDVAARLDPSDAEARYAVAVLQATLGRLEEARASLRAAVRLGGRPIEERAGLEPALAGIGAEGR